MKIIVNRIYGPVIKKMVDGGWTIDDDPETYTDIKDRSDRRRTVGCDMVKEFDTLRDAILNFEKITGFDAIEDTDQSGCAVFWFMCKEQELCVAGWECGKHLYEEAWEKSPREVLKRFSELLTNLPYSEN